ncbi:MAG TPA: aminotransferase class IV [Bryobacteraceae bacterium]|nr:aminotransferase class IV [Bryobacteraceae bacterium]
MHRFILHNDEIHEASEKVLSPGQIGLLSGWGVFSTIKVIEGVQFAFERHWARMSRDAALMRVALPCGAAELESNLARLVEKNGVTMATMRVVVVRNRGGVWEAPGQARASDVIAFTSDIKDWGESVKLNWVRQARHAASVFAGTKILAWAMNLTWLEEAQCGGFDEVILLNEREEVAECTSANIFAAKGSEVWTPPLSSGCLPGITRELLLSEVRAPGIRVTERVLTPADLEGADEVFITSTTRDLLPVSKIGEREIANSGHTREALQTAFSGYVREYVAQRKREPAPARQG